MLMRAHKICYAKKAKNMKAIILSEQENSDLACERHRAAFDHPDVSLLEKNENGIPITFLSVKSPSGAAHCGCAAGEYRTMFLPTLFRGNYDDRREWEKILYRLLTSLLPSPNESPLLVVGLGNRSLTADTVGVRTAELVCATAHTAKGGVMVLTPGVLGESGLDAVRQVRAIANEVMPRAIIAVDALAANATTRLLSTIQITNTGISPGSGVYQARAPLNHEVVGFPVISIGIPTVIGVPAMIREVLGTQALPDTLKTNIASIAKKVMHVCPQNIDEGIENGASLIAGGINHLTR